MGAVITEMSTVTPAGDDLLLNKRIEVSLRAPVFDAEYSVLCCAPNALSAPPSQGRFFDPFDGLDYFPFDAQA